MSELNLKKLFVLVPSALTTVTLEAVKTKSKEPANSDKLYFVEKRVLDGGNGTKTDYYIEVSVLVWYNELNKSEFGRVIKWQ